MTGILLFGGMIGFMLVGVPVIFAIGLAAVLAIVLGNVGLPMVVVPIAMLNGMDSFPMMAVPFFVLAGELMNASGLSRRLIGLASAIIGSLRGGLGHSMILANALMSSISGSSLANIAAVGRVMIPAMEEKGYEKDFATSMSVGASLLGPIVPPSITMVIFAVTAEQSVGALFLAGVVPGLLIAAGLMVVVFERARRKNYPVDAPFSVSHFLTALKEAVVPLLMPVIILGGIFGGVMTPTESAAVAVLFALLVGLFVYRTVSWRDLGPIFVRTGLLTGFVMLVVGAARVFSDVMISDAVPEMIANTILSVSSNEIVILLLVNVLLFVIGCVMDTTAAIIILVPVLMPVMTDLGVDPVLFGIVMCVNLVIGMATPPVGVALYLGAEVAGLKVEQIVRTMGPFLLVYILVLLLITYVPDVALWLPHMFGY